MAARAELKARLSGLGLGLMLAVASGLATPALAQSSCEADIGGLQQKRLNILDSLTKQQQKDKESGKLDPIEACPKLRSLAGLEKDIQAYMEKNQAWCNIPDEALVNIKETHAKTVQVAGQACSIAAQMKKQQQQQSQGAMPGFATPAPKLPSGPL